MAKEVICVKNEGVAGSLTEGRPYTVIDEDDTGYELIDNNDEVHWFYKYRFLPVTESDEDSLASSTQVGGSHYHGMAIQPYTYCLRNKLGPCETNAISYISRWKTKYDNLDDKIEDLEKAIHTLQILIEHTREYGID